MSKPIIELDIFLASPSNLIKERVEMRKIIDDFNNCEAIQAGYLFCPIMWEDLPATRMRPQERINKDLRRADFFVLVLWDRWGSSTGNSIYSSGVEEEFRLAEQICCTNDYDLKDIAVFFKAIDSNQLKDPGKQLQKVLDFKNELDAKKQDLYRVFDSLNSFKHIFRAQLAEWLRTVQRASNPNDSQRWPVYSISPMTHHAKVRSEETVECAPEDFLCKAIQHENEGQLTQAESCYVLASENDDLDSLHEYGRFLLRIGRIEQARQKFQRMIEVSDHHRLKEYHAMALSDLSITCRLIGELEKAILLAKESLHIHEALDNDLGQAKNLQTLGIIYRMRGDLEFAGGAFCRAFQLNMRANNFSGMANNLDQIGIVYRVRGNLAVAEEYYLESLEINLEINNLKGIHDNRAHLASVHRLRGELDAAEKMYREAVAFNQQYSRSRMLAETLGNLGTTLRCRNQLIDAERYYKDALELNMAIDCKEGMARQYSHLAALALKKNDLVQAEDYIGKSMEINMRLGLKEGLAANFGHRGIFYLRGANYPKAIDMFMRSMEFHEKLGCNAGVADCCGHLGNLFSILGDADKSVSYFRTSYELFRTIGMEIEANESLAALNAGTIRR